MEDPVSVWRKRRLRALIDKRFNGNAAECGRAFGYGDGAFIRQMTAGRRPITEKTATAVETLPMRGLAGWFAHDTGAAENTCAAEISVEARRVVGRIGLELALDQVRRRALTGVAP